MSFKTSPDDSVILGYLTVHPVLTAILGLAVWVTVHSMNRNAYDPLPLIGHLHIFLSRPRWGHLEWFLNASKYHLDLDTQSPPHSADEIDSNVRIPGLGNQRGLSWLFKIPGTASSVFTSDPACIKYVLVTKANEFSKTGLFADITKDMLGNGILVVSGDTWRKQRQAGKLLGFPSTLSQVHDEIFPTCLEVMMKQLDDAARSGEVIDFQRWAKDLSLAVFGMLAYRCDPDKVLSTLADPFDTAINSLADRFGNPFWPMTERLTASGRRFRSNIGDVKRVSLGLVASVFDEAKSKLADEDEERRLTLVEMMLKAGIDDVNEIADSCLNFTIAGRDTTAHALTWTIYQLLRHPRLLDSLISTIDNTSSDLPSNPEQSITGSILPRLSAHFQDLTDVLFESLRLHPPIPTELAQQVGSEPLLLPSGQLVSPGQFVTWSPWVMARLPSLWGPTAGEFDPARWKEMREKGEKKSIYELPTFHAGPKACLGKDLAKVVMIRTMESLLRKYQFEMVDHKERKVGVVFTGEMQGGLELRVKLSSGMQQGC